ncbi:rRNA maturation RNase YbeY [Myxosarcina sp. GI1(2024)]
MNLTSAQIELTVYVETIDTEKLTTVDLDSIASIDWNYWFQTWLECLRSQLTTINSAYELSLRLTSDREIATFNRQYRHQNQATDVLVFAALEADIPQIIANSEPVYLGDLIISLDTAIAQARTQNHSLITELAWLSSHGLLHLLGWDHPDKASLNQMLARQSDLLTAIRILGS